MTVVDSQTHGPVEVGASASAGASAPHPCATSLGTTTPPAAPAMEYLPAWLPPSLVGGPSTTGIAGAPAAQWRGLLLDSSRTFWTVDTILELFEIMHRYGFNRLHWHLTDNSGWRLAVPGYPRIMDVAAQQPRHLCEAYTNVPMDDLQRYQARAPFMNNRGFYTREDVKRIVERASELGIEVMPEIDLPGHAAALIAAYPEFGNPSTVGMDLSDWPGAGQPVVRNDLLWPGEETFAFMEAALTEVCVLFPSRVIHIGGDECDVEYWESNPEAQAWMQDHEIADGRGLHRAMMDRAREVLAAHGRTAGVWDEAVEVGLGEDDVVFAWRDHVGVPTAVSSGHPWVLCDAEKLYLNRLADPDLRPDSISPVVMNGAISVQDIAGIDWPAGEECLGIQASVWCEFVTERAELYRLLFPRLLAVAAKAHWGNKLSVKELQVLVEQEFEALKEGKSTAS